MYKVAKLVENRCPRTLCQIHFQSHFFLLLRGFIPFHNTSSTVFQTGSGFARRGDLILSNCMADIAHAKACEGGKRKYSVEKCATPLLLLCQCLQTWQRNRKEKKSHGRSQWQGRQEQGVEHSASEGVTSPDFSTFPSGHTYFTTVQLQWLESLSRLRSFFGGV